mgnify:CR=1 FL=1
MTTNIASPIIQTQVTAISPQTEIEVSIQYASSAIVKQYKIGNSEWQDYIEPFPIYANTTIYAKNSDIAGNTSDSALVINNIIPNPTYTALDKGTYYIIKPNYPSVADQDKREYKWTKTGTWKKYDPDIGIILIKPGYENQMTSSSGIQIEDEDGNKVICTDHYYVINCPLNQVYENIFLRWDNEIPPAPTIIIDPSDVPTKKVTVTITFGPTIVEKQYKIVTPDGEDSGWLEYTAPFEVNKNNSIIYSRAINQIDIESNVAQLQVTNIDEEEPIIKLLGDTISRKQSDLITVSAEDNMQLDQIKYAEGSQDKEYFENNGTVVNNNSSVLLNENGTYTFYAVDSVGNSTIKELTIANLDHDAPTLVLNNKTQGFGNEAQIEIDYGDSSLKEYKIGTGDWQTYTGEITLKSEEVYNLAEDGVLTVYVRGKDNANNLAVISEVI